MKAVVVIGLLFGAFVLNCGGNPVLISKKYPRCEKDAVGTWLCKFEGNDGKEVILTEPGQPEVIEKIIEVPVPGDTKVVYIDKIVYRDRVIHVPKDCGLKKGHDKDSDDGSSDD